MNEKQKELIKNAIKGDKQAIIDLIKQEENNIYTTIFYLKKDKNDISDIMQNVLMKMAGKITQLKNPAYFKTWLNQIIVNTYYDYLRKIKKMPLVLNISKDEDDEEFDIPDYNSNPTDAILRNELDMVIKHTIENLPLHYKIPIALREIQGLSYDEISNITKTAIGTVKSRIARARAMIKDKVNKYAKE